MHAIPTKESRFQLVPGGHTPRRSNLVGKTFGLLTVVGYIGRRMYSHQYINVWRCRCKCGNECDRVQRALLDPGTSSCGCGKNVGRPGHGNGSFNALLASYRRGAADRGLEFTLTDAQFRGLTKADCYYCGAVAAQKLTNGRCSPYIYNGVDRSDNRIGYTVDNSRPCCGTCNFAKRTSSEADFLAWARLIIVRHGAL